MKRFLVQLFQRSLVHPCLVPFYTHLYKLSLRGMGILNSEGSDATGERWLFQFIKSHLNVRTLVDIGANDGGYTSEFLSFFPEAQAYCFEPNPETYQMLKNTLKTTSVKIYPIAVSDHSGNAKLYDLADNAPLKSTQPTATLASLYPSVITELHHQPAKCYSVKATTLDHWATQNHLSQIDWVKIDTEGHELAVLKGAHQLIKSTSLGLVQFEFNDMHAYSATFFKNLLDELPGYSFYRLLPHGWWPLPPYRPLTHEIFGFQNIVALSPKWFGRLET